MERFSTLFLFFFLFLFNSKNIVSIPVHCGLKQFTTEKPELSWNNKCDHLVQSIWVMWQKRSTGNNQRWSIKTLHQTPKTITKNTFFFFFLHPIDFYAPSEYRGWLCNDVNKMFIFFFLFSIFRVHRRIMSHCLCLCHQRVQNSVPVREHLCTYCQHM